MTVTGSARARWFRRHPASGVARMRVVCLPHAGGTASFFHSWGKAFGDGTEVLAACYPGRQERLAEPCLDSMAPLADAIADELIPFLDLPVVFFGHSLGASLAYEVTLRLQKDYGDRIAGLFVSAREAPHRTTPKTIHLRDDEGLIAEAKRLGGTDAAVLDDPGLRELVIPALRSDFRIAGTYRALAPVAVQCPVFGYVGEQDSVKVADMREWSDVSPVGFGLRVFPGGHFYLVAERDRLIDDIVGRIG
ncbi:alpha/beta fold hydrolase [Streptomyces sp. SID4931]|nr:alpha/beta fold hydrolase [Streptomyces sp. SID4931]SCF61724.1 Surfactin synthase thioesterase subunit [Streptomyces sp. Ncost-T6T-2b]